VDRHICEWFRRERLRSRFGFGRESIAGLLVASAAVIQAAAIVTITDAAMTS
jgi:hypothetical protein